MTRILLLGGTTEASEMAWALANAGIDAVFSYAGRTLTPMEQPLPIRIGGFGGVEGLVNYLATEGITHVIDATHPFAAQMSRNAVSACHRAGVALIGLERPEWTAQQGDIWSMVGSVEDAADALPEHPSRVFLAIGKQLLGAFARRPEHHYLLRLVDPPESLVLPNAEVEIARGPFTKEGDIALLLRHRIDMLVAKNSGGTGAEAKLLAARDLGLPVIFVARPDVGPRHVVDRAQAVMRWLSHGADLGV